MANQTERTEGGRFVGPSLGKKSPGVAERVNDEDLGPLMGANAVPTPVRSPLSRQELIAFCALAGVSPGSEPENKMSFPRRTTRTPRVGVTHEECIPLVFEGVERMSKQQRRIFDLMEFELSHQDIARCIGSKVPTVVTQFGIMSRLFRLSKLKPEDRWATVQHAASLYNARHRDPPRQNE